MRNLILILILSLSLVAVGCGGNESADQGEVAGKQANKPTKTTKQAKAKKVKVVTYLFKGRVVAAQDEGTDTTEGTETEGEPSPEDPTQNTDPNLLQVNLIHGNKAAKSFKGQTLTFSLAAAKTEFADSNGDGLKNAADLADGTKVNVQVKQAGTLDLTQPLNARVVSISK